MTAKVETLDLVGNRLCLDFVNTVNRLPADGPVEFLTDEAALSAWAKRLKLAAPQPVPGDLKITLRLREALHSIFYAVAHSERPFKDDLETLKLFYLDALRQATLEPSEREFGWQLSETPYVLLHTLTFDALDLLQSNLVERVRYCQNEACNWLFLDTTRSRTKRWCSATGCGNRMRVKRFSEKKR